MTVVTRPSCHGIDEYISSLWFSRTLIQRVQWRRLIAPTCCEARHETASECSSAVRPVRGHFDVCGHNCLDGRPTAHADNQHGVDEELLHRHLQDAPRTPVLGTPQAHCVRCWALGCGDWRPRAAVHVGSCPKECESKDMVE
jgi:hypothetical protein